MLETQKLPMFTIRDCISLFSRLDQKKIFGVVVIQIFLGALDLLGVAIIGLIGALAVTGIQSATPGNRVSQILEVIGIDGYTFQSQTAILGLAAAILLVGRTMLSVFFTRKILFFIGRRSAVISGNLVRRLLVQDNLQVNNRTIQETIYAATIGVTSVTLGVVGTLVVIIADVTLLLVMSIGLLFLDLLVAISTFLLFSLVGFVLYRYMKRRAFNLGNREAELNVLSNEKIAEVLTSYREATVRSRRGYYAEEISKARYRLSDVIAELSFMPSISKYVVEGTIIIGAVSIAALQFFLQDASYAIANLAVFMAAGTRIAPAVLRVQQGSITLKSSLGAARPTLALLSNLPTLQTSQSVSVYKDSFPGLMASVSISDLNFTYPGSTKPALQGINLEVEPGSTCAIVGPSGSGKTTLVDIILGMFEPTSGAVSIFGKSPKDVIRKFPGAIAYVPQDVSVFQGSIRQNVALGYPINEATDHRVMRAIQTAQLEQLIGELPEGLESNVGPRGVKMSGGQRQRLGIARAMFTQPKLLVLDESTSSLDAQIEVKVSEAIASISDDVTKIIIAHRLSTVRHADKIVYLDNGKIQAVGSFEEVRAAIPDFDFQAKLMGL